MLAEDNKLHPLDGSTPSGATSFTLPDGRVAHVAASTAGRLDSYGTSEKTVGRLQVPSGVRLSDYSLATMSIGAATFGKGNIVLTDAIGENNHYISAYALPDAKRELPVRVGSCLQWHGYDPGVRPVYVIQDSGSPVAAVTLSRVRD